jgi:hypothetical protein
VEQNSPATCAGLFCSTQPVFVAHWENRNFIAVYCTPFSPLLYKVGQGDGPYQDSRKHKKTSRKRGFFMFTIALYQPGAGVAVASRDRTIQPSFPLAVRTLTQVAPSTMVTSGSTWISKPFSSTWTTLES